MNRALIVFKIASITRFLCLPAIVILDHLWSSSISDTGPFSGLFKDGLDIDFPWWVTPATYIIVLSICINTIISLLLSFNPGFLINRSPGNAVFIKIFIILEALMMPFFGIRLWEDIQHEFFPGKPGIIGSILNSFFPRNNETDFFERLQLINLSILFISILIYLLLCWKVFNYRISKRTV